MSYRDDPYQSQYSYSQGRGQGTRAPPGKKVAKSPPITDEELMRFYQLQTLSPDSWEDLTAVEFDYDPDSTDDVDKAYEILKNLGTGSTAASTLVKGTDGPDPLGYFNSVTRALHEKNLIRSDLDPVKQKYLVNLKQFDPILFLRDLHDTDTFNTLNQSLDFLERLIAEQSKQLRLLIRDEFVRFVRSKSSLDGVFDQIQASGLLGGTKESPLAMLGANLTMASLKASAIMKPIVDNRKKENALRTALNVVDTYQYLFDLPSALAHNIEKNAYESLSSDYNKGRDIYYELLKDVPSTSLEITTRGILKRVWEEVEAILDSYKKDLWNQLARADASDGTHLGVILKLLELGVEDNPIVAWMDTRYRTIVLEIRADYSRIAESLAAAQVRVLLTVGTTDVTFIYYLRSSQGQTDSLNKLLHGLVDAPEIIEMWLLVQKMVDETIVSAAAKIKQYWLVCEQFLSGKAQQNLPKGYKNESEVHHHLPSYEKERAIQNGESLVKLMCDGIERFLVTSRQGLASLATDGSAKSPSYEIRTPEHYGFIPPHANSIGTIRYLEKFLVQIFLAYNSIENLRISKATTGTLKQSFLVVLQKFIVAVCSTWANDVQYFHTLEDHKITAIKNELGHLKTLIVTNEAEAKSNYIQFHEVDCTATLPELVSNYESFVIKHLRNIVYIDGKGLNGSMVYTKPSEQLLNSVKELFLNNLKLLLLSMMKKVTNENKGVKHVEDLMETRTTTLDLYELWTLDNFIVLEDSALNEIVRYFDKTFGTSLHKRGDLEVFTSILPKLQEATFNNYCETKKKNLGKIIQQGIEKVDWKTLQQPSKVSAYIYECLTYLVILHLTVAKVSATLIFTVVHELQNHICRELAENLKMQRDFSTGGIYQLMTDIRFFQCIFGKTFKLGKTATANLNLIFLNIVKPRANVETVLDSVMPIVEKNIEYSKYTFNCFYQ